MTRPSDPPGVTYEGEHGVYTVKLHGRPVGTVIRRGTWVAYAEGGFYDGPRWSGVNRGEAVTPLIAWHQAGRP